MDAALRKQIDELGGVAEEFKGALKRIETLEAKGDSVPDLKETLDKINDDLSAASSLKASMDTVLQEKEADQKKLSDLEAANDDFQKKLEELALKGTKPGAAANEDVAAHRKGFDKFMRKGKDEGLLELQIKLNSTLRDPDGGFAVPEMVDQAILEYERVANPMRGVCQTITVGTPDYKKLVNLGGAESGWVGEEDARPETVGPKLAQLLASMGEVYANPAATQISLDDVSFDVEDWIAREVSVEFAEKENAAFTSGDGVNKPAGIMAAPAAATTDKAGTRPFGTFEEVAGAFDGDGMINLVHSLRAGYRANARFMMTNLSLAATRIMKDGQGNYLWRAGLEEGQPDRILGYGIVENEEIPEVGGAGTNPLLFGDFNRGYLIVDRIGTRVLRDPFTAKPFVHFYTTKRVGGMTTDSLAIKKFAIA